MIIDDEEFCITAMQAMLNIMGINVKHHIDFCINGKEAISKLTESYKKGLRYTLIFTDVNMPVMDGIKATHKIRGILSEQFKI